MESNSHVPTIEDVASTPALESGSFGIQEILQGGQRHTPFPTIAQACAALKKQGRGRLPARRCAGAQGAADAGVGRLRHQPTARGRQRGAASRQCAALVAPHQPRVALDVGRHDGSKAALLSGHRSASAALGSSRPAAMRRNVVARLRSSDRPNGHVPSNLLLKNSADATFCNVSNMAFALSTSPTPMKPSTTWVYAWIICGLSLSARDPQSMPSAYRFAMKHKFANN